MSRIFQSCPVGKFTDPGVIDCVLGKKISGKTIDGEACSLEFMSDRSYKYIVGSVSKTYVSGEKFTFEKKNHTAGRMKDLSQIIFYMGGYGGSSISYDVGLFTNQNGVEGGWIQNIDENPNLKTCFIGGINRNVRTLQGKLPQGDVGIGWLGGATVSPSAQKLSDSLRSCAVLKNTSNREQMHVSWTSNYVETEKALNQCLSSRTWNGTTSQLSQPCSLTVNSDESYTVKSGSQVFAGNRVNKDSNIYYRVEGHYEERNNLVQMHSESSDTTGGSLKVNINTDKDSNGNTKSWFSYANSRVGGSGKVECVLAD